MSTRTTRHWASRLRVVLMALALVASALTAVVAGPAQPASAGNSESVRIGMPFKGQWAYNALVNPPYTDANSSHPSVHATWSPESGEWGTDLYAAVGTTVRLRVGVASGNNVTYSWKSVAGSCGGSTGINVFVDGVHVGWLYYTHMSGAVKTGAISNGMVLGSVADFGDCNSGHHVHVEFRNTQIGYSCYYDKGNPGVLVADSSSIALLGANNSGARQECGPDQPGVPTSTSRDYNADRRADLVLTDREGSSSGFLDAHVLNGADAFHSWLAHSVTDAGYLDENSETAMGDYNADGRADLAIIKRSSTGSGMLEVHVLDGADAFHSWLAHSVSASGYIDPDWSVAMGDYNGDKRADIALVDREGSSSNRLDVHVLNGADAYHSWLVHSVSASGYVGSAHDLVMGDYNADGKADLTIVKRSASGSGVLEVHVLNGADAYHSWLAHSVSATGFIPDNWHTGTGDYNADGKADLYLVNPTSSSGKVDVHVLNGADAYHSWLLHSASAAGNVPDSWGVAVAG